MIEDNKKENSIIPITPASLVRVGNSIDITNKILKEHDQRLVIPKIDTVKIGNQEWMVKNLDVDRYRNGYPIPMVTDDDEWEALTTGAYCYYNNDPANGATYGKLYNWYAVNDPRGLAPEGWHIPSDEEWTILTNYLGGGDGAGTKMKSSYGWEDDGNGSNSSGFAGLPGGSRGSNGAFGNVSIRGYWWSATESGAASAWSRYLDYRNGSVNRLNYYKQNGFSVRCLGD